MAFWCRHIPTNHHHTCLFTLWAVTWHRVAVFHWREMLCTQWHSQLIHCWQTSQTGRGHSSHTVRTASPLGLPSTQQVPRLPHLPDQRARKMIRDLEKTGRKEGRIDSFPQPLLTNNLQTHTVQEGSGYRHRSGGLSRISSGSPIATRVNTKSTVERQMVTVLVALHW